MGEKRTEHRSRNNYHRECGGIHIYLGSNLTHNLDNEEEVSTCLAKAYSTLGALDKLWRGSTIKMPTKVKILNTMVFSTALYGCETWTFVTKIRRMLLTIESKCSRRIVRVKWTQTIANDTIFS